jgi:transposase-like protein
MHSPAWTSSVEARKAAADAAATLLQSGQDIADIAKSMSVKPSELEAWVKEYYRPERIRGAYIAPDENTLADHEARLDAAAQDAQERYGLGWYQSEMRASLPEADRQFLEQTDGQDWKGLNGCDRQRYEQIQKSLSVSQEFVIRLFEFLTHGYKVTRYKEKVTDIRKSNGRSIEKISVHDRLSAGSKIKRGRQRRNHIVLIKNARGAVIRTFLMARIKLVRPKVWRIIYWEPYEALNKEEVGDRLLHLFFMAKLDRDQSLTQQQIGKLGGKTKAASSAMMRNMDKKLRESSQTRTGFLAKPPKQ